MTRNETAEPAREHDVCPPSHLWVLDNWPRTLIHNPAKLFGPYVRPGMTVLDIGCGGGFTSIGLARLVGADGCVIAADLQPEMLEFARKRAEKKGVADRIRWRRCEKDRIGAEGPADFAVAFYMVHETPDQAAFFGEVFSILRPGGRLYIIEPKGHVDENAFQATLARAQAAGFTVKGRPCVRFSLAALLAKPE